MTGQEKILFILNPISGGKRKDDFLKLLEAFPDRSIYSVELQQTEYPGHATILAKQGVLNGYNKIIAVGGDGTVNEVAKELISTKVCLGIIPFGSGNGLARHLKIPMDTRAALELLNHSEELAIDVGLMNQQPFFCTAGLGFDAHIGKVFAGLKGRGLSGYVKSVLKEYSSYVSDTYEVELNDKKSTHRAFLITAANAGQYGNNVYIAPQAKINDGFLDLCIVRPFSIFHLPFVLGRLLFRSLNTSSLTTAMKAKTFVVRRKGDGPFHLDGESFEGGSEFRFEIKEGALNLLVAAKTKK